MMTEFPMNGFSNYRDLLDLFYARENSKLMLDKSDYKESERLVNQLLNFCKNFCQQSKNLKIKIDNSKKK